MLKIKILKGLYIMDFITIAKQGPVKIYAQNYLQAPAE